jgi:predicted homoserine dehydrogenase-like protein
MAVFRAKLLAFTELTNLPSHSKKEFTPMSQNISIAVIGAGRTGSPLLSELLQYDYIQVLGVADLDPESTGMTLARERQIPCFLDPLEMVEAVGEVDILVEVSGDRELKAKIKQRYETTGNRHTIILHDLVARLVISVCTRSPILVPARHPDDHGIG